MSLKKAHQRPTSTFSLLLSCWAQGWSDSQLLGSFIGKLKLEIPDDILAQAPCFLAPTVELSRIYENKHQRRRRSFRPFPIRLIFTVPTSSSFSPPPPPKPVMSSLARPPLCLSLTEVKEHRAWGQCHYCVDKYNPSHTCATPSLRPLPKHILMTLCRCLMKLNWRTLFPSSSMHWFIPNAFDVVLCAWWVILGLYLFGFLWTPRPILTFSTPPYQPVLASASTTLRLNSSRLLMVAFVTAMDLHTTSQFNSRTTFFPQIYSFCLF